MKKFLQDSSKRFIQSFSQSYDAGADNLTPIIAKASGQMQMQNNKDLEYLEGSTRDRMFSYTYNEHTRARLFNAKTAH